MTIFLACTFIILRRISKKKDHEKKDVILTSIALKECVLDSAVLAIFLCPTFENVMEVNRDTGTLG